MGLVAIVCRDLAFLRLLHPICEELYIRGIKYILYLHDFPRGEKEYNRASMSNVQKSSPAVINWSSKTETFSTMDHLYKKMIRDNISKMISIEIGLWLKRNTFPNHIKNYSLCWLTDSLWQPINEDLTKVYFTTNFLMNKYHSLNNIKLNPNRDKAIGSTLFDPFTQETGDNITILLPNLRSEHVSKSFGSGKNFIKIIQKIYNCGRPLIFKTRDKQWFPQEIKQYAFEIKNDVSIYPPTVTELFKKSSIVVNFFSSGIFESVYSNNYVINIPLPLRRWSWDQRKLKDYFINSGVYNFKGVVESIDQSTILDDKWKFIPKQVDQEQRSKWIEKYIGICHTCPNDSAKNIVDDIMIG